MAARARKPLRVVTPDEVPTPPVHNKSVTQAAVGGDPHELLVAMRDRIAEAVEDRNTAARDLAALTRRLREIARDIEAIDVAREQEGRDGNGPASDEAFDPAEYETC